jgi:hypothetical protein
VQFQLYLNDTLLPAPNDIERNIYRQHDFLPGQASDFIVAPFWPISDQKKLVPLHDTRYYHTGTTYGQNEPHVADSGVVINGVPVSSNG